MRTRVKICGITRVADALAASNAGADAIGLNFWSGTPRFVEVGRAREIADALPAFVTKVALFVDPDASYVRAILDAVPVDTLQFHGTEDPALCRSFGRPYLKAVRVKHDVNLLEYAARYADARGLLVDAYVPGVPGGTGEAFDWSLLPADLPLPLILSGGLGPHNAAEAARTVRPWALDVSSGVESGRGIKDLNKIAAFIQAVHAA